MRIICAIVVVVAAAGVSGAEPAETDRLVVRIYDAIGLAPRQLSRAAADARRILSMAGLDADWRTCTAGEHAPEECAAAPDRRHLVVRLVHSAPHDVMSMALGRALIDPATGTGTLATVFIDRIERLAQEGKVNPWRMTGRVIAHEVGHLLLGTNSHANTGLMRPLWTLKELVSDREKDWLFSNAQQEQLRATRHVT